MLSFSNDDLAAMNEDVDEIYESDSSDDDPVDIGMYIKRVGHHRKFRKLHQFFNLVAFCSIFTENPPLDKKLRKRKREEEREEAQQKILQQHHDQGYKKLRRDDNNSENEKSSTDDESADESPSAKFRRGCGKSPSDLGMGSNCGSDGSESNDEGDDGDWNMMGAALEREFLGLE